MNARRLSSDIISTLPETIIQTILCLLPIKEAGRTSILSREWRYKWTKVPKLVFDWATVSERTTKKLQSSSMKRARKNMDSRCKLFYVIQQVLLLHQGPLNEFALDIDSCHHCYEIDQIILHLSRKNSVKKLTLKFDDEDHFYKLPSCGFSLHQLTDLTLEYVDFGRQPLLSGFVSLRSLCINGVETNTKSFLQFLSQCPSLKSLHLRDRSDGRGYIGKNDCTIMELFECLQMIERLTLSREFVQQWLDLDSIPEEPAASLIHLKHFRFKEMCFTDKHGLVFLAVLIKCSPNLEKITLKSYERCCEDGMSCDTLAKYSDVWLEHLSEVAIDCVLNRKPHREFMKFILARSPKLKKLIIRCLIQTDEENGVMPTVLFQAPHASPVVEIVVNYGF